jgi:cytochrome c peroxidase
MTQLLRKVSRVVQLARGTPDRRNERIREFDCQGNFKTPTLREIACTAPYMHDGIATLENAVEYYDRGGNRNPHLDPELHPLHLSSEERRDLVLFLRSLSAR